MFAKSSDKISVNEKGPTAEQQYRGYVKRAGRNTATHPLLPIYPSGQLWYYIKKISHHPPESIFIFDLCYGDLCKMLSEQLSGNMLMITFSEPKQKQNRNGENFSGLLVELTVFTEGNEHHLGVQY